MNSNAKNSAGSNSRKRQDNVKVYYPPNVTRITNDPYNPYGYINPNTGYEMDARTGRPAWRWSGTDSGEGVIEDPKRKGMYRQYYNIPSAKDAVTRELNAASAPSSGGAPVGGAAGSPGNTGAVGDMQSRSGSTPTSYGLAGGQPQPPIPQMQGAAGQPQSPLPFTISHTPAVDVGQMRGSAPPATAVTPEMSPEEWNRIAILPFSRPQTAIERPEWKDSIASRILSMPAAPMPPQQEAPPWYQRLIESIIGR